MLRVVFFSHFSADPFFNMAFDEWMFETVRTNNDFVLMRLYTWATPTITIGLNQKAQQAVDWSLLGNTPVIRRVTGGRAVYHDLSELTYSISANPKDGVHCRLSGSVSAVHQAIAQALVLFLEKCRVSTEIVRRSSPSNSAPEYFHTAPCFDSVARDELVCGGRKILASAQRRVGSAFLQHGSIKLSGLATHPALTPTDRSDRTPLDPVDESRFNAYFDRFKRAMSESLELQRSTGELLPDTPEAVSQRGYSLRNNPLERRIIL